MLRSQLTDPRRLDVAAKSGEMLPLLGREKGGGKRGQERRQRNSAYLFLILKTKGKEKKRKKFPTLSIYPFIANLRWGKISKFLTNNYSRKKKITVSVL